MRVLVACEFSGVVRRAFRERGHDAWSCDLEPAEDGSPFHIQADALIVMQRGLPIDRRAAKYTTPFEPWDLMIAHPPCTYLCSMGIWWNHKRPERVPFTLAAFDFVMQLASAAIPRIAIENPVGYIGTHWRKADQLINPWQFGHEANKPTLLWLKNLPALTPTNIVGRGKFYTKANGARMSVWSHITSGTRKEERARIASRTFAGIAAAMAEQWG